MPAQAERVLYHQSDTEAYAVAEMRAHLPSIAAMSATVAISRAACGSATSGRASQSGPRARAPAVRRVAAVMPASHPTVVLAAGWMPSGSGFAITARRYAWRAHSYVALSVSVVGHAKTRAGIERQVAAGDYGSTQINIDRPSPSFLPSGLVDCAAHPGVLLFGWTTLAVRASLRQDGVTRTLQRTIAPARLGLSPGALLYGSQTSTATITQPGVAAEPLGPPPQHRDCRDSTESIMYGFASSGAVHSSRAMSGSG